MLEDLTSVHLYCKGHSAGNVGAWACCLNFPNTDIHHLEHGTQDGASHNLMEVEACIRGFERMSRTYHVSIFTNNTYLRDGINLLLNGTHYDTNPLAWLRLLDKLQKHTVYCQHMPKVDNTGYMRLVDSTAFNLLPPQYRRGVS